MAAAANIVLNDAQATPVAHTFIPLGPDQNGVWWFEDQSAASPIGYNRISVSLTRPLTSRQGESAANRVTRVKIGVHTPKLENVTNSTISGISPAPTISYTMRSNVEFILPEKGSLQDRKDLRKYVQFAMADAAIVNAVESLQGIW